jgi:hypothetical protein
VVGVTGTLGFRGSTGPTGTDGTYYGATGTTGPVESTLGETGPTGPQYALQIFSATTGYTPSSPASPDTAIERITDVGVDATYIWVTGVTWSPAPQYTLIVLYITGVSGNWTIVANFYTNDDATIDPEYAFQYQYIR